MSNSYQNRNLFLNISLIKLLRLWWCHQCHWFCCMQCSKQNPILPTHAPMNRPVQNNDCTDNVLEMKNFRNHFSSQGGEWQTWNPFLYGKCPRSNLIVRIINHHLTSNDPLGLKVNFLNFHNLDFQNMDTNWRAIHVIITMMPLHGAQCKPMG